MMVDLLFEPKSLTTGSTYLGSYFHVDSVLDCRRSVIHEQLWLGRSVHTLVDLLYVALGAFILAAQLQCWFVAQNMGRL